MLNNLLFKEMNDTNEELFTSVYRQYWEALFITAVKVLRDKEEAADIVQDVFLSFWKRRNELNIEGSLAAYLHTSVRYKCIQNIKKNITRRDYLQILSEAESGNFLPRAESDLQLKELQQNINNTVANMPCKMQKVYNLSRNQHLSHKEIAGDMSISVETVKKHIQHAMNLIKINLPYGSFISTLIFLSFSFLFS